MTSTEKKQIRELTMGCWWPSVAFPRKSPDWVGIAGELEIIIKVEDIYFCGPGNNLARFYKLRALWQLAKDEAKRS